MLRRMTDLNHRQSEMLKLIPNNNPWTPKEPPRSFGNLFGPLFPIRTHQLFDDFQLSWILAMAFLKRPVAEIDD